MKYRWCLWVCMILLLFSMSSALSDSDTNSVFEFPAELTEIGYGAFEKTRAVSIVLSDKVEIIGDYAFCDMKSLRMVFIPKATRQIGVHILVGTKEVVICGVSDSFAEEWAYKFGYRFVRVDLCFQSGNQRKKLGLMEIRYRLNDAKHKSDELIRACQTRCLWQSLRPQERAELHAIDYYFP